jgi:hypothetical protein
MRQTQRQLFISLSFLLTTAIFSCNNETEKTIADTDTPNIQTPPVDEPVHLCYAYIQNKDTVKLELVVGADDTVSGDLLYQLDGKDRNNGTLKGIIYMDTILADYTFKSEGTESIRQVTFLKSDNSLAEGYAAMEEKNGKMEFKKGVVPDYSKGIKLMLTKCKN